MHNWNGSWGWGAWFAMGFMMLAFWGLIVAVLVMTWHSTSRRADGPSGRDTGSEDDALRVLDARFARGEIDAEEYTNRRDLLRRR